MPIQTYWCKLKAESKEVIAVSSSTLDNKSDSNVRVLNEEQAQAHFEELVQNYLGIRADEFLQRYQRGEYKDVCDDSRLLKIIMMIPKSAFGHK